MKLITSFVKKAGILSTISFATVFTNSLLAAETDSELAKQDSKSKQPNIMWIISEDNSKHYLKLYDSQGASMPTVEKLAANGLIFDHAFANSPVCSTARTTLATGLYGTSLGTMNHRGYDQVSLPAALQPVSQTLKDAGYYTTNNVKTDYNFVDSHQYWNESSNKASWQNRNPQQPFFHVQTFGITHEGKLHFKAGAVNNVKTQHNPDKIKVSPIHPDTELFRYTYARTLDNHLKADNQIANLIGQLEQQGELENTFIFYFGDHGGVLPGSKGYIFERGLSVPLVVRIPENFKHLVANDLRHGNTRVDGLVSFIDFAPTLLKLANLPIQSIYPGKPFLSPEQDLNTLNKRDTVFASADRFDEKSDLVRSVRKGQFKYIRNYQPYYPDGLENFYRYKQLAFQQWRDLYHQDKLSPVQAAFFEDKPVEALFDIDNDPFETVNLAENPDHQGKLMELRELLNKQQQAIPDLGFIAESRLLQTKLNTSYYDYGQQHHQKLIGLIAIADLNLLSYEQAKPQLMKMLNSKDADVLYRTLVVLSSFSSQAKEFTPQVKELLEKSDSIQVRTRAWEFLSLTKAIDPVATFSSLYKAAVHDMEKVELLNVATLVHEKTGSVFPKPETISITSAKQDPKQVRKVNVWLENRWRYISQNHDYAYSR